MTGRGAGRAAVAVGAGVVGFCVLVAACRAAGAQAGPAVTAAALAIAFARRGVTLRGTEGLVSAASIVVVAFASAGVAYLIRADPPLGAAVFVAGVTVSVWLRNFGARGRRAGAAIALPFVAMLVVPARPAGAPGGPLVDLALTGAAGFVALACVAASQRIAERCGVPAADAESASVERPPASSRGAMTPATRMALQMLVALASAFVVGFAAFPQHWSWSVLTAFVVCSGARGRGDALYKGALRLAGAIGGTLVATAVASVWTPRGPAEAVAVFAALFAGLWLRDVNYAYWAACMTLVLALLAGGDGQGEFALLATRLTAILAGALCGAGAAWFVFPIRTEAIVRRRLADALRAFDEVVARAEASDAAHRANVARFERGMAELERVAPPVRWHRRIFARAALEHPARWIDLARDVHANATPFASADDVLGEAERRAVRRAIGASRRAIADRGANVSEAVPVSVALDALRNAVSKAAGGPG